VPGAPLNSLYFQIPISQKQIQSPCLEAINAKIRPSGPKNNPIKNQKKPLRPLPEAITAQITPPVIHMKTSSI
jgi:hypothetical protein